MLITIPRIVVPFQFMENGASSLNKRDSPSVALPLRLFTNQRAIDNVSNRIP